MLMVALIECLAHNDRFIGLFERKVLLEKLPPYCLLNENKLALPLPDDFLLLSSAWRLLMVEPPLR